MKILFKTLISIIVFIAIVIFTFICIYDEPLPKGEQKEQADVIAKKMLTALNANAFKNAELICWSFRNNHHYKWYKQENKVEVSWEENKVILFTKNPEKTTAFVKGKKTDDSKIIAKATEYFNNDSFWLIAPYKVFDKGTERSLVKHNNKDALLITYSSGGTTPGDSYLWILNNDYMPTSYKMWVKIIPVGGLEATWENWITTKEGFKLPTQHTLKPLGLKINMENIKTTE